MGDEAMSNDIDFSALFQKPAPPKTLIEEAREVAKVLLEIQQKLKLRSNRDNAQQILFRLRRNTLNKASSQTMHLPALQRIFDTAQRLLGLASLQRAEEGHILVHVPGKRTPRKSRVEFELAVVAEALRLTGACLSH